MPNVVRSNSASSAVSVGVTSLYEAITDYSCDDFPRFVKVRHPETCDGGSSESTKVDNGDTSLEGRTGIPPAISGEFIEAQAPGSNHFREPERYYLSCLLDPITPKALAKRFECAIAWYRYHNPEVVR